MNNILTKRLLLRVAAGLNENNTVIQYKNTQTRSSWIFSLELSNIGLNMNTMYLSSFICSL